MLVLCGISSYNLPLRPEAVVHVTKEVAGGELSKRDALVPVLDGNVGMRDGGGGEEDQGTGRELDDELHVPKNQVPSFRRVKEPHGFNPAPTEGEVAHVAVLKGPDTFAEIEGGAGEHGFGEGAVKPQSFVVVNVVAMKSWCPQSKRSCG